MKLLPVLLLTQLLWLPTARADSILYCNDYLLSTDHMASALGTYGGVHTVTSTSSINTCEAYIAAGSYDLVILAIQNQTYSTPYFNAHVAAGGKAILQDWTRDGTRGGYMGISYSGSNNNSSITVTDSRLTSGLASNPFSLSNPGWNYFSMGFSTSGSAAYFSSGDDAIAVTNNDTHIVNGFLTDTISSSTTAVALYCNEIDLLLGVCDVDGDGYDNSGCGGSDCDDNDASVYPGAPEVLYDGVDSDCDGHSDYDADYDGYDNDN